jgi:hypothetical protein
LFCFHMEQVFALLLLASAWKNTVDKLN